MRKDIVSHRDHGISIRSGEELGDGCMKSDHLQWVSNPATPLGLPNFPQTELYGKFFQIR